jgi:hypothetical protein
LNKQAADDQGVRESQALLASKKKLTLGSGHQDGILLLLEEVPMTDTPQCDREPVSGEFGED